jgi:flavin-dependent dehydrogenase
MHMVRQSWGKQPPQILIVGSGISGLALAVLLKDLEAKVTVLTQVMEPGRPTSFHGIVSETDWKTLGLSIPESCEPVAAVSAHHFLHDDEPAANATIGWTSIEHADLLARLVRDLAAHGTSVLDAATVTSLVRRGPAVTGVRTDEGRVLDADLVVFADQSDPRLPEMLGLRPDWPPTALMHLGKARYDASPDLIAARFGELGERRIYSVAGEVSWGAPFAATVVPGSEAFTVTTAMMLEDEMVHAKHIREVFDEVEVASPVLGCVRGLTESTFFTEVVPIGGYAERHRLHDDHVMVVSDLVGVTHPLNRDGLSVNLDLCVMAAGFIRQAVQAADFSDSMLAPYSRGISHTLGAAVELKRRRDRSLMSQPAWTVAAKSELVPGQWLVTQAQKPAKIAPVNVWNRLRPSSRRSLKVLPRPGAIEE